MLNYYVTITSSQCMSFDTYTVGGEYRHKLTIDELPSHAHKPHDWDVITAQGGNTGYYNMTYLSNRTGVFNPFTYDYDKNRYGSYVGNNEPHYNVPPYVVTYFWRRIA